MTKMKASTASLGCLAQLGYIWSPLQCLLLAVTAGFAQEAQGPYTIGPNVQISASLAATRHYETYVAADRKHAGHLIACAFIVHPDNQIDNVFYVSFDRGATWSHTLTVPASVDPSCAIGLGGAAFAASIHDLQMKTVRRC
jgi:hypothetical protein